MIMPATVQDAYSMTLAAIRDDNPVVSLEHRLLYDIEGPVVREHEQPLCKVNMLKTGSDLTLITTSWMAVEGTKAAEVLERLHNVKIDVVDVCSIQPLDRASIIQSARKTGRVVIADYDWDYCGFSAELSTIIYEECFMQLKSPITRMGFAPVPCPTTRPLEQLYYTNSEDIIRRIEEVLQLEPADLSNEAFSSYE